MKSGGCLSPPGKAEKTELLPYRLFSGGLSLSAVARIVLLMGSGRPRQYDAATLKQGAGGGVPVAHAATGGPDGDRVSGAWRREVSRETG